MLHIQTTCGSVELPHWFVYLAQCQMLNWTKCRSNNHRQGLLLSSTTHHCAPAVYSIYLGCYG